MTTFHRSDLIPNRDLITDLDLLPTYDRFLWNICDGCDMSTGDTHSFGHLVPSHLGFAYFEQNRESTEECSNSIVRKIPFPDKFGKRIFSISRTYASPKWDGTRGPEEFRLVLYDTPGLAFWMDFVFWGQRDFQISFSNRYTTFIENVFATGSNFFRPILFANLSWFTRTMHFKHIFFLNKKNKELPFFSFHVLEISNAEKGLNMITQLSQKVCQILILWVIFRLKADQMTSSRFCR